MSIICLQATGLGVPHGFLGRSGGVSTGVLHSLNMGLGADDAPENVHENRRRGLQAAFPAQPDIQLVTVYQVHGTRVAHAASWPDDGRPKADALVSNHPGLALGILTADCAPLLFADGKAGVIGAAHAGWKGALAGIIDATIAAMEGLGASRQHIRAAVGPCIGRRSYEVDMAYRARFLAENPENAAFFTAGRPGHAFFDLEGYCLARLAAAGVSRAEGLGVDTCADARRFFSYRRGTLAGDGGYGRQLSVIALPA